MLNFPKPCRRENVETGKNYHRVRRDGFTLIELMIVVAIIGILAAVAIPKFADLVRKSNEGATKGNLGAVRSALSIYYGDQEGLYPNTPAALTTGGDYIDMIPEARTPSYHADSGTISQSQSTNDTGGWGYNNTAGAANFGFLFVNCSHTDSKGSIWSSY
ncbi:MAG: prepilin-type N-terminal cleavage/methylation domain-containing protein [Elusimicrobiota bacterium]